MLRDFSKSLVYKLLEIEAEERKEAEELAKRINGKKWKKAEKGGDWHCLVEDEAVEFQVGERYFCENTGRDEVMVAGQLFAWWGGEGVWKSTR